MMQVVTTTINRAGRGERVDAAGGLRVRWRSRRSMSPRLVRKLQEIYARTPTACFHIFKGRNGNIAQLRRLMYNHLLCGMIGV